MLNLFHTTTLFLVAAAKLRHIKKATEKISVAVEFPGVLRGVLGFSGSFPRKLRFLRRVFGSFSGVFTICQAILTFVWLSSGIRQIVCLLLEHHPQSICSRA